MSKHEELKKRLVARYEQSLEELLSHLPNPEHLTFNDLEKATMKLGISVTQATLQGLSGEASLQVEPSNECPKCGGKGQKRGKRSKTVISSQGEIQLERAYYVCSQCGAGFFPLDEQWYLNESAYSREMARKMVWLTGLLPFKQCQAVFLEIAGRIVPSSSIWRQGQRYGRKLWATQQEQTEQVSVERIRLPDAQHDHAQKKGISMDGGMVNVREEGWREVKVGAAFDIGLKWERDPHTKLFGQYAHAKKIHYCAVLGNKDAFAPHLWALAVQHEVPTAQERVVIADGAAWIWNLAEDICPDAHQIVDWYHASQHIHQAAQALFPQETHQAKHQGWVRKMLDHLHFGRIDCLIKVLKAEQGDTFASYFETHKRRMKYLEFREEGYPIGSGMIESGVKQFKRRVCGTGMRWKADTLNPMLLICGAVLGNDFDSLWQHALAA
jgi:DNA-directed RNA polymerase subunit RPC12/RpoP